MADIDKIFNEDCLEGMKRIPDGSIDLVVTSPPYDNLRTYNGVADTWSFDKFKGVAREIARTLKDGGVCVWVVGDATIKGSETGTSFRQALYFKDECGLNLHDTMIWEKKNYIPLNHNRYEQSFEYMFVFTKNKPSKFNPIMVKCDSFGKPHIRTKSNKESGSAVRSRDEYTIGKETKIHKNIFSYSGANQRIDHPAIFPEKLAIDHIISWSNENDIVLDPFMGSGTTAIACIKEKRHFIGFELNEDYYKIACERIKREQAQPSLF